MVEGKFKRIRKVGNNGYTRQSWKIHQVTGPQEGPESILFNQRISNTRVQEAAGLMGSSGVANFCRSHLTVGDVIIVVSSLEAKGITGSQKDEGGGGSGI